MARRRYQNGSVFLRGKREQVWIGRWREDIISGDGSVARVRRSEVLGTRKQLATRKLALRELASRVADVNQPDYRGMRSETFAQFAQWWQTNVVPQYKRSTAYVVGSQLRTALIPYFGRYMMKDITYPVIVGFVNACQKSPKTRKNYVLTLKMMWKSATAGSWVSHDPFENMDRMRCPQPETKFYTADEARAIIAAAEDPYKSLYWIAAETGLRSGELAGLRLENLDLEHSVIRVTHSVWRGELQSPKSPNALRSIAISEALTRHLVDFLKTWKPNPMNFLFLAARGKPIHMTTVHRDKLNPLCRRLGIESKGFMAFRHCSATMMDQARVPQTIMQERLGHKKGSQVTYRHYTHAVEADARTAASTLGGMLQ